MEINDDLLSAFSLLKNRIMKTTHTCDVAIVMEVNNNYVKCKLVNSPEVMITCYKIPSLPAQVDDKVIVIYTDKDTRTNLININNNLEPVFVDEDKTYHSLDYGIIISNLNYTPQSEGVKDVKVNGTSVVTDDIANVSVPTKLEDLSDDSTHRVVTDSQISNWNSKQSALTFDNTPTDGSNNPVKSDGIYDALQNKVDKEAGKVLSSNDFTDTLKNKLDGIESNAQVNVNADWNAVSGDAQILNKPTIPDELADLQSDSTHRVVTDTQITTWDNKQNALSSQTAYTNKGTSTKVPQISTNSLGQVTNISEINIDYPVTSVNGRTGAITGLAEATDIPVVNDATLTIQKNGTQIAQFSANASSNVIANISVPVNVSELVNDSDYATKSFVNSSIATNTANFRGTYDIETDLGLTTSATEQQISDALNLAVTTKTNNDYVFVAYPTSHSLTDFDKFDRYKYDATNQEWNYEYTLNNSSFTAQQWSAINSGITATLVGKITTNETNISNHTNNTSNPHSVTKSQVGLGNVDNTSDLNKPISTATQTALNGKQDTIDSSHKLNSDLVDDTNQNNKFVSASEKSQITTNQTNITNILDGTTIDSFSDVETEFTNYVDKSSAQTISGAKTFSSSPVLNNAVLLRAKNSGGTLKNLIGLTGANNVVINNENSGNTLVGGSALAPITANHNTMDLGVSGTNQWRNAYIKTIYQNGKQVANTEDIQVVSYDSSTKKLQSTINSSTTDLVAFGDNAFNSTPIPTSYVSSVNGSTGAITNIATLSDIPTVNDATLTIQQNGVQVQTFSANQSSNATANIVTCNPNLLINPDFAINQRGIYTVNTTNKYGFDRWKYWNGGSAGNVVMETQTSGTYIGTTKITPANAFNGICQFIEDFTQLKGKTVTLSCEGTFPSSGVRFAIRYDTSSSTDVFLEGMEVNNTKNKWSISFTIPDNIAYTKMAYCIYSVSSSSTFYIKYAKMEVGNIATEFSPPVKADELLKCQRYFLIYRGYMEYSNYWGLGVAYWSTTRVFVPLIFRVQMRVTPTFKYGGNWRLVNTNVSKTDISLSTDQMNGNGCCISATSTSGGLTSGSVVMLTANNDTSAYMSFDADF